MVNIFRIVAICGFFFFLSFEGIFASEEKPTRLIDLSPKENTELSWAVLTGTSVKLTEKKSNKVEKIIPKDDTPNESTISEEDDKEKENIQNLINSYILETYKAQWEKILKDMDLNLQKKIPDIEKRIKAYDSIQTTLELRKTRILKVNLSESNKQLLSDYFDYMIDSLEKRKDLLTESLEK